MYIKSKGGDKLCISIERLQNGELTLQVKQKLRIETDVHASYVVVCLLNLHGVSALSKLDLDMQQLVLIVEQRDRFVSCSEEVEIEDVSNLNLDWLVDMKELEIKEKIIGQQ